MSRDYRTQRVTGSIKPYTIFLDIFGLESHYGLLKFSMNTQKISDSLFDFEVLIKSLIEYRYRIGISGQSAKITGLLIFKNIICPP